MANNQTLVDIIICTKNNRDIIGACLNAVNSQSFKQWRCLVVDDGSTDESQYLISEKFPWVKLLRLKGKGPAYNRNVAIKKTTAQYIVTLDSDTVLTKDWLKLMVKFMEDNPMIGIAGSKILYQDKPEIINMAGGNMLASGLVYHLGNGCSSNAPRYHYDRQVFYVSSAAMIIRRQILKAIDMFDSDYGYGYEDLDLCWRANLAGFPVFYCHQAEAFHWMNATIKTWPSEKLRFLSSKNRVMTLLKNYQARSLVKYSPLFLFHFLYLLVFKDHRLATINGYWWNIINLSHTLKKRGKIDIIRKINDWQLTKLL